MKKIASSNSRTHAEALAAKVYHREVPIARDFIRSSGSRISPLASVLRGGRGGEVRLKLLLSLLWVASKEPHDTQFPSRAWAELLDLDASSTNGTRRVHDAIVWLQQHAFIRVDAISGHPSRLLLLNESGTGEDYVHPVKRKQPYIKIPADFWTNGWVVTLSGVSIALLLILLDAGPFDSDSAFWLTPAIAHDLYGLSEDSWTKGTRELEEHGLILILRIPVNQQLFEFRRVRKTYRLNLKRLRSQPES